MKLREMGVTTLAAVGVTLVVVAVLGVTFLSERSPIRADDPEPSSTATSTQATTTMPERFPTPLPDPPCYEEFERKYGQYSFLTIGTGKTNCVLYGPGGDIISEAEAFLLIAERERTAAATQEWVDPVLSARSITLADGRVIHLPDDVHIADFVHALEFQCLFQRSTFCPVIPFYKLARGDSIIWVDSNGVGFKGLYGDEIAPDAFPFITEIEEW